MKTLFLSLFLAAIARPALAQRPLRYAVWVDGVVNAQLPKSSLYFLGAGLRGEVSRPVSEAGHALFGQVGYARFFQKATGAFTANTGLATVGYRYQVGNRLTASVGVGAQYWSERMRVRFPDEVIGETFRNLIPAATLGLGVRVGSHYALGLEYRGLFKPEPEGVVLRNHVALSVGYTF